MWTTTRVKERAEQRQPATRPYTCIRAVASDDFRPCRVCCRRAFVTTAVPAGTSTSRRTARYDWLHVLTRGRRGGPGAAAAAVGTGHLGCIAASALHGCCTRAAAPRPAPSAPAKPKSYTRTRHPQAPHTIQHSPPASYFHFRCRRRFRWWLLPRLLAPRSLARLPLTRPISASRHHHGIISVLLPISLIPVPQVRGYKEGEQRSAEYNAALRLDVLRYAMADALQAPRPGFEDVLRAHFRTLRHRIMRKADRYYCCRSLSVILCFCVARGARRGHCLEVAVSTAATVYQRGLHVARCWGFSWCMVGACGRYRRRASNSGVVACGRL